MKIIIEISGGVVSAIYHAPDSAPENVRAFVVDLDAGKVGDATRAQLFSIDPLAEASDITRECVEALEVVEAKSDRNAIGTPAQKRIALAESFGRHLRSQLGELKYQNVIRLNALETHPGVCHSHEYCDANMVMAAAFKVVVGHESDVNSDYDTSIWNDAWTIWKADAKIEAL